MSPDADPSREPAETDPDPAEEASQEAPKEQDGSDAVVPGAGTAGAGGAQRARDDES